MLIYSISVFRHYSKMMLNQNSTMHSFSTLPGYSKIDQYILKQNKQSRPFVKTFDKLSIFKDERNCAREKSVIKKGSTKIVILAGDGIDHDKQNCKGYFTNHFPKTNLNIFPRGFYNIGNSCYMNATLQCLLHLNLFCANFVNQITYMEGYGKQILPVSKEIHDVIKQISRFDKRVLNLTKLKRQLGKKKEFFNNNLQHDAQQYLTCLLQILNLQLTRIKIKCAYKQLQNDPKKKSIIQLSNQWWNYYKQIDNSIICDIFQGQIISTTRCQKCQKRLVNFDNIMGLSVAFRGAMSVYQMVSSHWKVESIVVDYYCTQCKKHMNCYKISELFRLPKVLVIQLKRFQYEYGQKRKKKQEIKIDKQLNLSKILNQNANKNQKCLYRLKGIVHHSGQAQYGHYYAQVYCNALKRWYELNDSQVEQISINQVSRTAYLLFYEQEN